MHDGQSGGAGEVPDGKGLLLEAVHDFPFCSGLTQLRPPTSLSLQPHSSLPAPSGSPPVIDLDADSSSCESGQRTRKRGREGEESPGLLGSSPALPRAEDAAQSSGPLADGPAFASLPSSLETEPCSSAQQEGEASRIAGRPASSPPSQSPHLDTRVSTALPLQPDSDAAAPVRILAPTGGNLPAFPPQMFSMPAITFCF